MAGGSEHDLRAPGAAARRMAGFVFRTYVGLGFHDPTDGRAVGVFPDEIFSKQLSGDVYRGPFVEVTWEFQDAVGLYSSSVAITGAWSLVPISLRTAQSVARAANRSLTRR